MKGEDRTIRYVRLMRRLERTGKWVTALPGLGLELDGLAPIPARAEDVLTALTSAERLDPNLLTMERIEEIAYSVGVERSHVSDVVAFLYRLRRVLHPPT